MQDQSRSGMTGVGFQGVPGKKYCVFQNALARQANAPFESSNFIFNLFCFVPLTSVHLRTHRLDAYD